MSEQSAWQGLTVKQFFSQYNWQGPDLTQIEPTVKDALGQRPWQWQTVQDFFRANNWHGVTREPVNSAQGGTEFSLALSVGEYFSRFEWHGQPEIAAQPHLDIAPSSPASSDDDLNLTDLSDLF